MSEPAAAIDEKTAEEIRQMSFEQAMAKLEEIVQRLESGQVGLEESIEIYCVGAALKAHCEAKLRAAQERVERIVVGGDGEACATEPLDVDPQ